MNASCFLWTGLKSEQWKKKTGGEVAIKRFERANGIDAKSF